MHADALQRPPRDEDLAGAVLMAVALHVGLAAFLLLASWWSPAPREISVAGPPVINASLVINAADIAAAERTAAQAPKPEPAPPPPRPAEEAAAPPPQPEPAPRPQDSERAPQPAPQEAVAQPDTTEQEEIARLAALAAEREREEQEAKRRQEQIDLTERQKQEEAERRQRLREQQLARLEELRRQRAEAERRTKMEEQRLQQLADREAAPPPSPQAAPPSAASAGGNNGVDTDLSARYALAMLQTAQQNWNRVLAPERTRCEVRFTQIPGGEVIAVEFLGCPFDAQARESVERALRRTPMPYQGFEPVFRRQVTLTFCYPEEACR